MRIKLTKLMAVLALGAVILLPGVVWAYTINDSANDSIGYPTFESYGINVHNYTPGVNSGAIGFSLFTNYPQAGLTVGEWATKPADVFITESYKNPSDPSAVRQNYQWAIPLIDHDGFTAGTMYAVGTFKISDDFEPVGGGYDYNHNVPVALATVGNNYGWTSFTGGTVTWNALAAGLPDWRVDVLNLGVGQGGIYQDDPNGTWCITWGTATCANDVVGCVPIPPSVLLLGSGLLGLGFLSWRKKTEV
jgi:hypothetical protein